MNTFDFSDFWWLKIIAPIVTLLVFIVQDATKYIWPKKSSIEHKGLRILLIAFAIVSSCVTIFTVVGDSDSNKELGSNIAKIKHDFSKREKSLEQQIVSLKEDLDIEMSSAKTEQEKLFSSLSKSNSMLEDSNNKISFLNEEVNRLNGSNEQLNDNLRDARTRLEELGDHQFKMGQENAAYNDRQWASLTEALKHSKECNDKISKLGKVNLQINTDLGELKNMIDYNDYPAAQEKIIEIEKKSNNAVSILNWNSPKNNDSSPVHHDRLIINSIKLSSDTPTNGSN